MEQGVSEDAVDARLRAIQRSVDGACRSGRVLVASCVAMPVPALQSLALSVAVSMVLAVVGNILKVGYYMAQQYKNMEPLDGA